MRWLARARLRARALFRRRVAERELDAELQSYVDEMTERGVAAGMDRDRARQAALAGLGGLAQVTESCKAGWPATVLDEWVGDVKQGLRALRRTPAFTAVTLLTLAVGIGASTAMFSQMNAVFLTPLPVRRPNELRLLDWTSLADGSPRRYNPTNRVSYSGYLALRHHAASFSDVACWSGAFVNLAPHGRVETHVVSSNYFQMFGVAPRLGRLLSPDVDGADARVAVISDGLWEREFGREPSVIGRTLRVNGEPVVLVGVAPRRFVGLNPFRAADLYLPLSMYSTARHEASVPRHLENDRDWSACDVVARLKPGVSDAGARDEAQALIAAQPLAGARRAGPSALGTGSPAPAAPARRLRLTPAVRGTDDLRVETSQPLWVLMAATTMLLVLACVNVAGLLIARVPARAREIGTRLALGASRWRVMRQMLTESLLLALMAGAAGVLIAYELNRLLPGLLGRFIASGVDIARVEPVTDLRTLLFALIVAMTTGAAFGLAPAASAVRADTLRALRRVPVSSSGRPWGSRMSRVLVGAQVALALVLLVGAGLLARTVENLRIVGAPDVAERQLHFSVSPGLSGYRDERIRPLFQDVVARLAAAPGVTAAGGMAGSSLCVSTGDGDRVVVAYAVSPDLFAAAGRPMLDGRPFRPDDREDGPPVAIVNEAFVRELVGGRRAIGASIEFCRKTPSRTIVGIVADTSRATRRETQPALYIPFLQSPQTTGNPIGFTLRTEGDPAALVTPVRQIVGAVAPDVPLYEVETGTARRERSIVRERLMRGFVATYGVIALFLASLGLYGVLAYTVSRRTAEVGLRIALGADRRAVMSMILRESLVPVVTGILAGVAAALVLTAGLDALLYGVSRTDPATIAASAGLLVATTLAAAWLPARRAARTDPARTMRAE